MIKKLKQRPLFIKIFNWEYWPFGVVYVPIYGYWLFLGIRARTFFFFNAANPTIRNGGFLMESKKEIYDLIPEKYYPSTLLFSVDTDPEELRQQVLEAGIAFPMIAKPDIGMRGLAVQKVADMDELMAYAAATKVDFLVQAFVPYELEVGIFYCRYPNESNGVITGIVGKEFLTVTGNGINTIDQLLQLDPRSILQLNTLRTTHADKLKQVLAYGQQELLVPYGNHARGAKFIDLDHRITDALSHTIDRICKEVPGFYYGRLDIKFDNWEALQQGELFSIIELNGAGSEPTHIYDPKHSVFFAWKEIIRHLNLLYRISKQNHQRHGIPYMDTRQGLNMFRDNSAYVKKIAS